MTIEIEKEARSIWLKEHEKCNELFTPQDEFYMKNIRGTIRVMVCSGCGYEDVECLHLFNSLSIENKTITCLLCGG